MPKTAAAGRRKSPAPKTKAPVRKARTSKKPAPSKTAAAATEPPKREAPKEVTQPEVAAPVETPIAPISELAAPSTSDRRRAIFIDVENTSSEDALLGALEQ